MRRGEERERREGEEREKGEREKRGREETTMFCCNCTVCRCLVFPMTQD